MKNIRVFYDLCMHAQNGGETMIFNTHDRTPRTKMNKKLQTMFVICYAFFGSFLLFATTAISIFSKSIAPLLIVLIPVSLAVAWIVITTVDMNKAYIEVYEHSITVVDYYFLHRRERTILKSEIKKGEITLGYSSRVRGYRHSGMGLSYIVFRNEKNKYLFKIINFPETKEYFSKLFEIQ